MASDTPSTGYRKPHGNQKISDQQVREICALRDLGMTYTLLAERYGISVFAAHYAVTVRGRKLGFVPQLFDRAEPAKAEHAQQQGEQVAQLQHRRRRGARPPAGPRE